MAIRYLLLNVQQVKGDICTLKFGKELIQQRKLEKVARRLTPTCI